MLCKQSMITFPALYNDLVTKINEKITSNYFAGLSLGHEGDEILFSSELEIEILQEQQQAEKHCFDNLGFKIILMWKVTEKRTEGNKQFQA